MTTRVLPPEEWHRLVGTEVESILPGLEQARASVIVVEDSDGSIVGTWALLQFVHAECLWIAPEHRTRGRVAARLLRALGEVSQRLGVSSVWTASMDAGISAMVRRLGGVPIPGDHFAIPVKG